jgi:hypothetical protein
MKILVPEAHAMGSIACIRSLGAAGHDVIATSSQADALGFRSRYCRASVVWPSGPAAAVREASLATISDHRVDLVLPSEGLVAAFGDELTAIAGKLPCGPYPGRLQRFVSKHELFKLFLSANDPALREHLPRTEFVVAGQPCDDALSRLQGPLFAKFDAHGHAELPALVQRFSSPAEAGAELPALLRRYRRGLVQQEVPGRGVGVFFLRWNGQILCALMHRRLHEVPHTGGVSSLRETWWDDELYADALRRIEAMDWWGVGMLEYRYAGPGDFYLMEFNARFWGSLHLALFAGADFPRLLVDAWSGRAVMPVRAAPGVRCRWTFPKELEYLWSLTRDRGVALHRKLGAWVEALALSLDPRVHSDLWWPGDRRL